MALAMEQMAGFMMAQQIQNQNHGQPRVDFAKAIASRPPPYYAGEEDPVILEEWIRTFDKLLNAVNCPTDQRVSSAVYYLTKAADNWWSTAGPDLLQEPDFGWEEFKEELRGQFYKERIKGIKCEEFLRLKQKGATVQAYYEQYVELMRFAQSIVPDEASKARRFVRGLDWAVRSAIAPFMCTTLKEAYDRASDHYQVYLDQQEVYGKNKRKVDDSPGKFRPDNRELNQGRFNLMQGGKNQRKSSACRRCGRDHLGKNCQGERIKCYRCGFLGHRYYECRTWMGNFRDLSQKNNQGGGNFQRGNQGRLANTTPNPNNKGKAPMGESSAGKS
ncbi:hypothetical protein ABN226_18495, partial [Morganella morganii]|uniref:hypothetical protein n=1 Tax=Morganella morganii TaxID=582 RepID=UPI0032DAD02A